MTLTARAAVQVPLFKRPVPTLAQHFLSCSGVLTQEEIPEICLFGRSCCTSLLVFSLFFQHV